MDIKLFNEVSWGGNKLAPIVDLALKEMRLNYKFELIETPSILSEMGITKTPAMMINGDIILEGKISSVLEMIKILKMVFENFEKTHNL